MNLELWTVKSHLKSKNMGHQNLDRSNAAKSEPEAYENVGKDCELGYVTLLFKA